MDVINRARRPLRRRFEKLEKELNNVLKAKEIDKDKALSTYEMFLENYNQLMEWDDKCAQQMIEEQTAEDRENEEHDTIDNFKMRALMIKREVEKLEQPAEQPTPSTLNVSTEVEARMRSYRLPKVEPVKFSGRLMDWLGFWAQFKKIDEDPTIPASDKFWHLLNSIEKTSEAYELVSSFPQSDENYPMAIASLKKQFGDEDVLLQVYIRELLSLIISNVSGKEKLPLSTLFMKLDSHLRSLKTLRLENADPATWLFPLVESSLPKEVLYNWQRSSLSKHDGSQDTPPRNRLDLLMEFISQELAIKRRIEIAEEFSKDTTKAKERSAPRETRTGYRRGTPTLAGFHVGDSRRCLFCLRTNHKAADCYKAKSMSQEELKKRLIVKNRCFNCFESHVVRNCESQMRCSSCGNRHHFLLCNQRKRSKPENMLEAPPAKQPKPSPSIPIVTANDSNVEISSQVALQTLLVKIINGANSKTVRAFIDSGSQRSYLSKDVIKELGLVSKEDELVVHALFGGKQSRAVLHKKYDIRIQSTKGGFQFSAEVRDQDIICSSIPQINAQSSTSLTRELIRKEYKAE